MTKLKCNKRTTAPILALLILSLTIVLFNTSHAIAFEATSLGDYGNISV